jgi:hypothetical protein
MSIRVTVQDGRIVPLEPLPAEWADGRELRLSEREGSATLDAGNGVAVPPDAVTDDDEEWLDDDEYERLQAALDEIRRAEKDLMRRRMGLE